MTEQYNAVFKEYDDAYWCFTVTNLQDDTEVKHRDCDGDDAASLQFANQQLDEWGYERLEDWHTSEGKVFTATVTARKAPDPTLDQLLGGFKLSEINTGPQLETALRESPEVNEALYTKREVFNNNWRVQMYQDEDADWCVSVHNGTKWLHVYSSGVGQRWYSYTPTERSKMMPVAEPTVLGYLASKVPTDS